MFFFLVQVDQGEGGALVIELADLGLVFDLLVQFFKDSELQHEHGLDDGDVFLIQLEVTVLIAKYCWSLRPRKIWPKEPSPILLTNLYGPMNSSFSISTRWWLLQNVTLLFQSYKTEVIAMKISRKQPKENFYSVKEIIDIKVKEGEEHCLVWWEGFPRSQATWQPTRDMTFLKHWRQYYQDLKAKYIHKDRSQPIELIEAQQSQKEPKRQSEVILTLRQQCRMPPHKRMNLDKDSSVESNQRCKSKIELNQQQEEERHSASIRFGNKSRSSGPAKAKTVNISEPSVSKEERSKKIKKEKKHSAYLNGKIIELQPVRVDIQIQENRELPFFDKELTAIKSSFIKNGEIMYEVEFQDRYLKEPIILHNKYLKLLWPKKLANHLLGKYKSK